MKSKEKKGKVKLRNVRKVRKSKEKLFKSKESYPNARKMRAPENVQKMCSAICKRFRQCVC